jgi:HEAT repeat protein
MNSEDQNVRLAQLTTGSPGEREQAAYAIAKSGAPELLQQLWRTLDDEGHEIPSLARGAADGFIDGMPGTISVLIEQLEKPRAGLTAQTCAYALGEIAYRQGAGRDERIATALIEILRRLPPDSRSVSPFVAALREYARAGPVPAANRILRAILERSAGEEEPDLFCLDNVTELRYINEGSSFVDEARARLQTLKSDTGLAEVLGKFLAGHDLADG